MLATSGRPRRLEGWVAEPKLDGWRSIVSTEAGRLTVRTRNGRLITDCVPELEQLAEGREVVLDGELIVGAGRLADFYRLSGRLAGKPHAGSEAVLFVAFDLLRHEGDLLIDRPYSERRERLNGLGLEEGQVIPSYDAALADDLLVACETQGMEGLVLKRSVSTYRPGRRSADWRKVKCSAWAEHGRTRFARHR